MRNGLVLALVAAVGLFNGLHLDAIPPWRQLVFVVLAVVAYLHGRHLPTRHGWLVLTVVAVPAAGATVLDLWAGVGALMAIALFVVLPWLAGRFRRQQAELVAAGQARVARLERERELIAERVTLRERARIAADMHDSLGHELALIALRAGALELADDLTDRNRAAAAELRASATEATDQLRRTIGLLRETGPDAAPAPVTPPDEAVEALVERARDAGMAVTLRRTGARPVLPPLVGRAVHRVVQEALTNAARHAPGAAVSVHIDQSTGTVTTTVANGAARDGTAIPGSPGGGSGLAGLRERVRLLGGTLRAGPDQAGFTVTACLPTGRDETEGQP